MTSRPRSSAHADDVPPRCQVCEGEGSLNARICRGCQSALGRRTAELLARARFDHAFACEAFGAMDALGQQRFRVLLGDPSRASAWAPLPLCLRECGAGPGVVAARHRPIPQGLVKCATEQQPVVQAPSAAARRPS